MGINLDDWIWYVNPTTVARQRYYRAWCDKCGKDKGYTQKRESVRLCHTCVDKPHYAVSALREKFIARVESRYGKQAFGYSALEYVNANVYVTLTCLTCGKNFKVRPTSFLDARARGCSHCTKQRIKESFKLPQKKFDRYITEIFGKNSLEVLSPYVNAYTKVKIKCLSCGTHFEKSPQTLYKGYGCPICTDHSSVGEHRIYEILTENKVSFIRQYKFEDCKNIRPLPFDFYIPSLNMCIEYDGLQHFKESQIFSSSLEEIKRKDQIKNNYCEKTGIKLLRISYRQLKSIKTALLKAVAN